MIDWKRFAVWIWIVTWCFFSLAFDVRAQGTIDLSPLPELTEQKCGEPVDLAANTIIIKKKAVGSVSAAPPGGDVTYLDSAQGCNTNATTVTSAAFDSLTGSATLIVIAMHTFARTSDLVTISDVGPSSGNSWVKLTQRGPSPYVTLAYAIVSDNDHRSATHQVRLTVGSSDYMSISVIAFSGTNSSQTPTENGANGAASGTVTGAIGDVLVAAACSDDSGLTGITVTDGGGIANWADPDTLSGGTTTCDCGAMDGGLSYWIANSTSAANSNWTLTGDTVKASAIASFQKQ